MVLRTGIFPYWSNKCSSNIGIIPWNKKSSSCSRILLKKIVLGKFITAIIACITLFNLINSTAALSPENIPMNKTLSSFKNVCDVNKDSYFMLKESDVKEMHFDFCKEISPIFTLSQTLHQEDNSTDYLTLNISLTGTFPKLLNLSRKLTCDKVLNLSTLEKNATSSYSSFVDILHRSAVCFSNAEDNLSRVDCTQCKVRNRHSEFL